MARTLEQAVHQMDLPTPGAEGEDFSSYVSRVAHAAAFVGAAWAIANGPQVQTPPHQHESQDGPDPDDTDGIPVQPGSVQRTHPAEQDAHTDAPDWMSDADVERERPVRHQDGPEHIVKEH